ncbi:unnamed protein product [Paramecium sonneborni]|uniref:Uncharacterized protein n=1 Tax=Paramecium sonneborni TaxID=65129 RepID=A0A8S1QRR6_9CILI|nr:unnamed protein product [Paramecium sonneborni]
MGNQIQKINRKIDQLLFKAYQYLIQEDELSDTTVDVLSIDENIKENNVDTQEQQQSQNEEQSQELNLYKNKSKVINKTQEDEPILGSKRKSKSQLLSDRKINKKICENKENYLYI